MDKPTFTIPPINDHRNLSCTVAHGPSHCLGHTQVPEALHIETASLHDITKIYFLVARGDGYKLCTNCVLTVYKVCLLKNLCASRKIRACVQNNKEFPINSYALLFLPSNLPVTRLVSSNSFFVHNVHNLHFATRSNKKPCTNFVHGLYTNTVSLYT